MKTLKIYHFTDNPSQHIQELNSAAFAQEVDREEKEKPKLRIDGAQIDLPANHTRGLSHNSYL
jgi:hypothetical protein